MIQRIQSVYLMLAGLSALLTFVLPYAHYYSGEVKVMEYAIFGVYNLQTNMAESAGPFSFPAWALAIPCTLLPFIALAYYKKRPKQHKLARLGLLLFLFYAAYLLFATDAVNQESGLEASTLHHIGFYLPVAGMVFQYLAIRGIRKDEALVKSLDRIR